MKESGDMRVDSRGLLLSIGDYCLVIHKDKEGVVMMTTGFYEGENDPPTRSDFNIAPVQTAIVGSDANFKGSYVFRLHSVFDTLQLTTLVTLAERTIASYEKTKRIMNPKRLVDRMKIIVESPDVPFDITRSTEFLDKIEEEE
jgi:hypothetical protein